MNALTISQPYASLIANGSKWIENRTWRTPYRGPLAIHAGKGQQYLSRDELAHYPTGCIIAVGDLIACLEYKSLDASQFHVKFSSRSPLTIGDVLKHEYTEGPWLWVLANVRKLEEPIRVSGKQGLWEFNQEIVTCR